MKQVIKGYLKLNTVMYIRNNRLCEVIDMKAVEAEAQGQGR